MLYEGRMISGRGQAGASGGTETGRQAGVQRRVDVQVRDWAIGRRGVGSQKGIPSKALQSWRRLNGRGGGAGS